MKHNVQPISTLRELAGFVDRDVSTVSRWTKHEAWAFGKPPWRPAQVPQILRWCAEHLRQAEAEQIGPVRPGDVRAELKLRKLRGEVRKIEAQADTAETGLAKERGRLLAATEVEQTWSEIGATVRSGFESLASEIIPLALNAGLPHAAAPELQAGIEQAVNRILQTLSEQGNSQDNKPPVETGANTAGTSGQKTGV